MRQKTILLFLSILILSFILTTSLAASNFLFSTDQTLANFIHSFSGPFMDRVMIFLSSFGEFYSSILLIILLSLWLYQRFKQKSFPLIGLLIVFSLTSDFFKLIIQRERPDLWVVEGYKIPETFSFPSGHVSFYTFFFGIVIFLALTLPKINLFVRGILTGISSLLIVGVGISRVYLGVHWPSDVFGGYLLGLVLLALYIKLFKTLLK